MEIFEHINTAVLYFGYLCFFVFLFFCLISDKTNAKDSLALFIEIKYQDFIELEPRTFMVFPRKIFRTPSGWCVEAIDRADYKKKIFFLKYIKGIKWDDSNINS